MRALLHYLKILHPPNASIVPCYFASCIHSEALLLLKLALLSPSTVSLVEPFCVERSAGRSLLEIRLFAEELPQPALCLFMMVYNSNAAWLRELSQRTLERNITALLLLILLYIGAQFSTNVLLCSFCRLEAVVLYYPQVHMGKDWILFNRSAIHTCTWIVSAMELCCWSWRRLSVPVHCNQTQFNELIYEIKIFDDSKPNSITFWEEKKRFPFCSFYGLWHCPNCLRESVPRPSQEHMRGLIIALWSSLRVIGFVHMYAHVNISHWCGSSVWINLLH